MSAPVFVDTNVFVYARDASEPSKQPQAVRWLEELWRIRSGRTSIQVLQEYYVTVTGKLDPGLDPTDARADVRALTAWEPLPTDAPLLDDAWELQDRHSLSFWDALVVAAARRLECRHLLTEDLQDGQSLDGVTVVNPFRHAVESIVAPGAEL